MRRYDWLYLVAALPFLFVAMAGAEHGAFWIYFVPALCCGVQFFFPTRLGWAFVTALYVVGAAVGTALLLIETWRFVTGRPLTVFVDADDAAMFILFFTFLVVTAERLRRRRPSRATLESSICGRTSTNERLQRR